MNSCATPTVWAITSYYIVPHNIEFSIQWYTIALHPPGSDIKVYTLLNDLTAVLEAVYKEDGSGYTMKCLGERHPDIFGIQEKFMLVTYCTLPHIFEDIQ